MFNFFKKKNPLDNLSTDVKKIKCSCAFRFYLNACETGKMKLNLDDIVESINTRLDSAVNKYFCNCGHEIMIFNVRKIQ